MLMATLAFLTSLLCVTCIATIELFHIVYAKQPNGVVFWKVVETIADELDILDGSPEDMV